MLSGEFLETESPVKWQPIDMDKQFDASPNDTAFKDVDTCRAAMSKEIGEEEAIAAEAVVQTFSAQSTEPRVTDLLANLQLRVGGFASALNNAPLKEIRTGDSRETLHSASKEWVMAELNKCGDAFFTAESLRDSLSKVTSFEVGRKDLVREYENILLPAMRSAVEPLLVGEVGGTPPLLKMFETFLNDPATGSVSEFASVWSASGLAIGTVPESVDWPGLIETQGTPDIASSFRFSSPEMLRGDRMRAFFEAFADENQRNASFRSMLPLLLRYEKAASGSAAARMVWALDGEEADLKGKLVHVLPNGLLMSSRSNSDGASNDPSHLAQELFLYIFRESAKASFMSRNNVMTCLPSGRRSSMIRARLAGREDEVRNAISALTNYLSKRFAGYCSAT